MGISYIFFVMSIWITVVSELFVSKICLPHFWWWSLIQVMKNTILNKKVSSHEGKISSKIFCHWQLIYKYQSIFNKKGFCFSSVFYLRLKIAFIQVRPITFVLIKQVTVSEMSRHLISKNWRWNVSYASNVCFHLEEFVLFVFRKRFFSFISLTFSFSALMFVFY